jgi:translation initiation factor IF-2
LVDILLNDLIWQDSLRLMRVYEFSKKSGIANKELVDLLKQQGFDVASHMSTLTDKAIDFLNNYVAQQQKTSTVAPQKMEEKPTVLKTKEISRSKEPVVELEQPVTPPQQKPVTQKIIQEPSIPAEPAPSQEGFVVTPMTVTQIAQKMNKPVTEIMLTLLKQGTISSKNQLLPAKTVEQLARHYQFSIIIPRSKPESEKYVAPEKTSEQAEGHFQERLPIIVVIGHVDHGKTTLLDFIRKTKVAAREQGGITQHLGAYQVKTAHGGIIFLDTPGHAAFIKMRARGVKVADIAVLVVAADDGVMPQTVEAIKHARNLKVPIIVAINKIDKATPAQIEAVKRSLTQYDLLPEEWGGQTICVPISAKSGQGVDQLLEMIQLQAEIMELRTDASKPAKGFVLEARVEKGRGSVATIIAQEGTIHVGDFFIAGQTFGKVNSIVDSNGKSLKDVGPSIPVQIAGFDQLPEAGDYFEAVSQDQYQQARSKGVYREEPKQFVAEGALNIIIKADTKSSKEALIESIEELNNKNVKKFQIIYSGIGDISESDVELAHTTGSKIYGFHVKFELNATSLAQKYDVSVHVYQVIYKLLDDLELLAKEKEPVKLVATRIGEAIVRKVFEIKNLGTIAGSYVKEGRFSRNGRVIVWRGKNKVGEGFIKSLERDRKPVKEVHTGFECAFLVDGFNEWNVDDRVECFIDLPAKA